MGANELLASDNALQAGQVAATSVTISTDATQMDVLAHALASLANAQAMLADATNP
jgi:hypothetical protein